MKTLKIMPKTFIYTLGLMLIIIVIAFILIYLLLPNSYIRMKENEINEKANILASQLSSCKEAELSALIDDFISKNNVSLDLRDDKGNTIYKVGINNGFSGEIHISEKVMPSQATPNDSPTNNIDKESTTTFTLNETAPLEITKAITSANGGKWVLHIFVPLEPVTDASRAVLTLIPYAVAICTLIAAVFAFIFAKAITKPVTKISKTVNKMTTLDKTILIKVNSRDEIGQLGENLNNLYKKLLSTIENLQKQIEYVNDVDKSKIDFMRAASHELKTPLTAINGMLEGMINEVGVFKDRDKYLVACRDQVNQLSLLIKEVLDASRLSDLSVAQAREATDIIDVSQLVLEAIEPYKVIAISKQVELKIKELDNIQINAPKNLLKKTISNILSNAVKFTPPNGLVQVYLIENTLKVENECEPIPDGQIKRLFEPFYKGDYSRNEDTGSTGLGLYITDRILELCDFRYDFNILKDGNGMVFTIYF